MVIGSTLRRGLPGDARAIAVALATTFTLTLSAPALAQDVVEGPDPVGAPASSAGIDFPVMLGFHLLTPETFTGPEWLAQFTEGDEPDLTFVEGTEALVAGVGKTIDDLSVTSALYEPSPGEHAVVAAFRIDGVDARDFVQDAVHLLLGDVAMPDLVARPMGNKWTLRVVDAERPGVYPRTVYFKDDTAWIVEGDEQYVWDALGQLPDPDPIGSLPGDSLMTEVPLTLDGRRRVGLSEAIEPLGLPTINSRLGPELDDWLLDLYLGAGITPSEMLGVLSWWGLASNQDSIQIEGYRLPEAGSELLERLRSEIFLGEGVEDASYAWLLEGVELVESEIAGRDVTTLDYGPAKQHFFGSEDTVWIVTDHVGEAEMAEEAIAALP